MMSNIDSDDDMNIEALEELLGSNTADMDEIEKNAELDDADAAFFDQLEDQIEDLNGHPNGDADGTAMNMDFTEPDLSVSESTFPEEPTIPKPLESAEESPMAISFETPEDDPVEDDLNPNVPAETEVDSLPGSSHSMQSQALDSDDDTELMDKKDEPIDQLIEALKEEEEQRESSATAAPETEGEASISKSIDVFSKLLPSHSVDGPTNLSADLQATAKALAEVSPNFAIGVKGKQSGLFGRFRRSGVPASTNEDEKDKAKEDGKADADGKEEEDETKKSPKASKLGFFGGFGGKANPEKEETVDEVAAENGAEKGEEEKDAETASSSKIGFFSAFRASPKSETQETSKEDEGENDAGREGEGDEEKSIDSPSFFSVFRGNPNQSSEDTNDEETKNHAEEKGEEQAKNGETDSSSGGGLFGVFRTSPKSASSATPGDDEKSQNEKEETTKVKPTSPESSSRFNVFRKLTEAKKDEQKATNLSPFEEPDAEQIQVGNQVPPKSPTTTEEEVEEDPQDSAGPGMFGYVSRKREEWNRRGTIDFPKTGPYSERTVRVGKLISEGSFATTFHATHYEDSQTLYVLKRINVLNDATREACEKESIICNVLSDHKDCIIPMLGFMVDEEQHFCYMVFPFMHLSLQAELDVHFAKEGLPAIPPWDEKVALYMFYLLLHAVDALHEIGYSHRNIQVENIYLSSWKRPVLSGFKNAGPLSRTCSSAKEIFEIANTASQSTSMAYRPPELFPGALMVGHDPLNYGLVDCWSLGCTLFAMLYGASPFECTFDPETGAMVKQECNQLSILADLPFPPSESEPGKWYSDDVKELFSLILEKDRAKRSSLAMIQAKVSSLLTKGIDPEDDPDLSETTDMEDFQYNDKKQ
ncbi:unnamed protein product [Cylindrotheca closterium]|uniref:non-specific serine/threonine protein kinase n=1 Tax=Cylindrotheca closterium TaxID=2856 RepID=A0AAD2G6C6_9STRA|nr:unnamed protein product [Cylindrotheca closterium]